MDESGGEVPEGIQVTGRDVEIDGGDGVAGIVDIHEADLIGSHIDDKQADVQSEEGVLIAGEDVEEPPQVIILRPEVVDEGVIKGKHSDWRGHLAVECQTANLELVAIGRVVEQFEDESRECGAAQIRNQSYPLFWKIVNSPTL